ncbi:MAG: acyl-CoA dehydrogenase family protein, partial [bacterium]
FILERGYPGFKVGKHEETMGIRATANCELIFEDCTVPAENLLGEEGEGFKIAMHTLDVSRIDIGAQAVGLAQGAYEIALAWAKERRQFGQPISANQAIAFYLADMATWIEAARQLVYASARMLDMGHSREVSKYSAMAKVFASDVAMKVTTLAVQIMGGYGYIKDYPAERFMRDAKITQIYEGTNEIQRLVISRSILK